MDANAIKKGVILGLVAGLTTTIVSKYMGVSL